MPHVDSLRGFGIRAASEVDAPLMAALAAFEPQSGWQLECIQEELAQPASRSWLAEAGEPLGYLLMRQARDEWEVIYLMVAAHVRRKGIGRGLITAALREIQAVGSRCVFLELRSRNVPAQSLYEALGFKSCGSRKSYYSTPDDDGVIMRLDLPLGIGMRDKAK